MLLYPISFADALVAWTKDIGNSANFVNLQEIQP